VTTAEEVLVEAGRLAASGERFALATVVSVHRPASTQRGDRALITPEGSLTGWIGGACSKPIVVREALRSLQAGQPRLVRIAPPGSLEEESPEDVVLAESHCASGGTIEVLIEPQLPKPQLVVIGESPAAHMLAKLARTIGWRVSGELAADPDAIVVATMGRMDEDVLAAALRTPARYVGLIASARRAAVVIDALRTRGVEEEQLARVGSPAGLALGPGSQEEIAVAILAELVACFHRTIGVAGSETVDPVCGMTVAVTGAGQDVLHHGVRYWFCGPGCRARFEGDPDRYAGALGPPAPASSDSSK
jgi:xanthine dehydrogenase accessory factor